MTPKPIEQWVQYTHLDKLYGYLPGMTDALPAVFGLTTAEHDAMLARFAERARSAARDLLADPGFAAQVDALPFDAGQSVLAVGDSLTDDLQSWVEILRHLLAQRRPDLGVQVINGGLSAHTTTMVLRRWPATITATRPDWVLCALGGNDITRVGPEPTTPQVGLADSIANLRRMQAIAPDPRWVWITPAPVCEDRVAAYPPFRFGGSTWRNTDIAALADAMRGLDGPLIDLVTTFGVPADPALQGPDGVHPTLAGQTAIVRSLVDGLTTHPPIESPASRSMTVLHGVVQEGPSPDPLHIRLRGRDSGGEVGLVEMEMAAGSAGPPLHVHPTHGEGFYVLAGELTFQVGDRIVSGGPGTWVFAPRDTPHTLANLGVQDARLLCVFAPAGFERRFERMIAEQAGQQPPGEPSDAERATRIIGPALPTTTSAPRNERR